ncbi:MAG: carbohydrate hydrolase [Acidobacteria bacterium]|nr:MAG: carbohydrate hydrolase [Acidobacteriota bacterium]
MTFLGYPRPDGRVGVRNHVVVISSVSCANGVVEAIGRELPAVKAITHTEGCGRGPDDVSIAIRTLAGTISNPNVASALVIGLGCEVIKAAMISVQAAATGKRIEHFGIQESGGTPASIARGLQIASEMLEEASSIQRQEFGLEKLTFAVECGGSDSMSGLTANACIGEVTDWLVGAGGTVLMSEITEFIGAEEAIAGRCGSPEVRERLLKLLAEQRSLVKEKLGPMAHMVIAPGNAEGGLSSIEEKSLGSLAKGGSSTIAEVVEYAEQPGGPGLVIMNTPGSDIFSMTGKIAGGAQLLLFSTGRGSPAGHPITPVIKVASNTGLFEAMPDDMDFNAGVVMESSAIADAGAELRALAIEVANGIPTKAEINRSEMFAIHSTGSPF